MIAACPSGALRIAFGEEDLHHVDGDEVLVAVVEHGPYVVRNVALDAEFNGVGASRKAYNLCRRGESGNKPFCDGTHHDVKWRDEA